MIKSHPFSRHYGPTPGAVGRYNSKLSASQIPKQREKVTEWICRDHGLYKGCGMVFFDQMKYNKHKKIRNISTDKMCPMKRKIEEEKEHAEKEARKIDVQPERKGVGAKGAGIGNTNQTLNITIPFFLGRCLGHGSGDRLEFGIEGPPFQIHSI